MNSPIVLESTVVSGNLAVISGNDVFSNGSVTVRKSAIGSAGGFTMTDLGGNLAYGVDVKLAPLAFNGGTTKTHAPLVGSPLINAGINTAGLLRDQRGGSHLRSVGTGVDIGAVEVQAPPRVSSVVVDTGTNQRSMVRSITVTFNRVVNLGPGAFNLLYMGANNPSGTALELEVDNSASTSEQTIAKLTWAAEPTYSQYGSLVDGDYRFVVVAAQVTDGSGQQLDGNGNGTGGDSHTTGFHRLFGDINGDRTVEGSTDFAAFGNTFGLSASQPGFNSAFDFNADGTIDGTTDFAQFGARFGLTL